MLVFTHTSGICNPNVAYQNMLAPLSNRSTQAHTYVTIQFISWRKIQWFPSINWRKCVNKVSVPSHLEMRWTPIDLSTYQPIDVGSGIPVVQHCHFFFSFSKSIGVDIVGLLYDIWLKWEKRCFEYETIRLCGRCSDIGSGFVSSKIQA